MAKAKPTATHALEPVFTAIGKDIGAINQNTTKTNDLLQQILAKMGNGGSNNTTPAPQPPSQPVQQSWQEKWIGNLLEAPQKEIKIYRFKTTVLDDQYIDHPYPTISVPSHLIGKSAFVRCGDKKDDVSDWRAVYVEKLEATYNVPTTGYFESYVIVEFIVIDDVQPNTNNSDSYPELEAEWD